MVETIEGYPVDLQTQKLAGQTLNNYTGYMGIASAFKAEVSILHIFIRFCVY
ncbi:MAG: hypothetical protein H6660_00035 [Ardenticatenaceae bacterium]|nr:hypothetical protein [Ardenticatenaceae bacterium]